MTPALLVNAGLRMLMFGLLAWLVLRIVRPRNPHVEILVWRMVLLTGLALPVLLYAGLSPDFATSVQLPVLSGEGAAVGSAASAAGSGTAVRALSTIYLAGVLWLLARFAIGLAGLWWISRAAKRAEACGDVRISDRIRSPATFGGVVLLPVEAGDWPAERLNAVLAHEGAHVRFRDGYWLCLAHFLGAIYWFSPLSWWLRRRLEWLSETTSDDAVISARHDPVAYAELLLDFARHPNNRRVAMSVAESNVSRRIKRLLDHIPPARELPRAARWAAVVLMVPAAIFAATTTRADSPAVAEPVAVVGIANAANPDEYYPALAIQEEVEGSAMLEADLDSLGQLVDVRVVTVEPADPRFGFADAALQVARNTRYRNSSLQPASFRFKVKFALTDK